MKAGLAWLLAGSCVLAGCATSSQNVVASYSSPMMYGGYSCAQLSMQDEMLRSQVADLRGVVDRSATNDKVMTGVGVVLFWPALLFIKGDGEAQSQYAELKGKHQAIEQAFVMKGCASADGSALYPPPAVTPAPAVAQRPVAMVPSSARSADSFGDGSKVLVSDAHRY